ncbi:MAG: hypothetical protein PVF93_10925 [Chromatiaceae bacterium]
MGRCRLQRQVAAPGMRRQAGPFGAQVGLCEQDVDAGNHVLFGVVVVLDRHRFNEAPAEDIGRQNHETTRCKSLDLQLDQLVETAAAVLI